jgi:hypothetical protein
MKCFRFHNLTYSARLIAFDFRLAYKFPYIIYAYILRERYHIYLPLAQQCKRAVCASEFIHEFLLAEI